MIHTSLGSKGPGLAKHAQFSCRRLIENERTENAFYVIPFSGANYTHSIVRVLTQQHGNNHENIL